MARRPGPFCPSTCPPGPQCLKVPCPTDLPRVKIDTYEGTVYLSGEVETAAQKAEAEAAARRVEGVEQVINDLHVRTDAAAFTACTSGAQFSVTTGSGSHTVNVRAVDSAGAATTVASRPFTA